MADMNPLGDCRSWKPHLIRRILDDSAAMAHGDVLLYSDAMNKIRRAPLPYLEHAGRNGTCTFQMVSRNIGN